MMFLQKYVSTTALFDMLLNKRLYFHPLYKFEDQWEGLPADVEEATLKAYSRSLGISSSEENATDLWKIGRYITCACCWHESDEESIAMWKIYAGRGQGFCVIAEKEKLIELVKDQTNLRHFKVKYVDRRTHFGIDVPFPQIGYFAEFKDRAYKYEEEYRFTICNLEAIKTVKEVKDDSVLTRPSIEKSKIKIGQYLSLEPESYVKKVIISPFIQSYEQDVIKKTVDILTGNSIVVETSHLKIA